MQKQTLQINPEHIARAMANSLAYAGETAHQITGVRFPAYTILVNPRTSRSWLIEVKPRQAEIPGPARKRGRKPKYRRLRS
jgi:hypothetical protein